MSAFLHVRALLAEPYPSPENELLAHDCGLGVKLQNCAMMNSGWSPQSGASVRSQKSNPTLSSWDLVQTWTRRSEGNHNTPCALSTSEPHLRMPLLRFLWHLVQDLRWARDVEFSLCETLWCLTQMPGGQQHLSTPAGLVLPHPILFHHRNHFPASILEQEPICPKGLVLTSPHIPVLSAL